MPISIVSTTKQLLACFFLLWACFQSTTTCHGFVVTTTTTNPLASRPPTAVGVTSSRQAMLPGSISTDFEAQVLTDLSHIALDFTGFLPHSSAEKLCLMWFGSILGRIFVISADYLPDHSVNPEELFVQGVLLSAAIVDIFKNRHTNKPASELTR